MTSKPEQQETKLLLATSQDANEMVAFHNSYYGTSRKSEHWLWEYQVYEPDKAVFVCAKDKNKLIATQGMIPLYMEAGGKRLLSGKSESTLLLPSYRGSTIMQKVYEHAIENCIDRGMQYIWGFTNAVKAFQKFGFTCYPGISVMARPGNIIVDLATGQKAKTTPWRAIGSTGKLIAKTFFNKNRMSIPRIPKLRNYEIKKGVMCDERSVEELYKRLKLKYKNVISMKYDDRYLRWRVREHPFIDYAEYQVYRGGILVAYAFVALFQGIAAISDLTSEEGYTTSLLLSTILKDYTKKAGRFYFLGNPKGSLSIDVFDQLRKFGFSLYSTTNLVVRDLTKGKNKEIFDLRNWHINGLWTEGYSM